MLVQAITVDVGAAVAKIILKLWLKDPAIDVANSLVDILKLHTQDVMAQHQGELQFKAIGLKVAESLLPIFETDGSRLEQEEQTAVALAVADTLRKAKITAGLLARNDLEPAQLTKILKAANPTVDTLLSAGASELYKRILAESSQAIVDIASQLPSFTERSFAEVLKRENELLAVAKRILDEVRRIREDSERANPELESARFEAEYRLAVVRALDEIELFGVDLSGASKRHRLSVAYVTLSVERQNHNLDNLSSECNVESDRASNKGEDDNEDIDVHDVVSVDSALADTHRLIIRGQAGSGKTTLLQWVAVRSASQTFTDDLERWNNTIPFFIRLRQFVDMELPAPENFPRSVARSIYGTMPTGWVHQQLKSGRGIILIDGLDEMPQSRRDNVRKWLKDLVTAFPDTRYLVTSRPSALEEGWMANDGFDDAELQPMETADIHAFIDHWHDAVNAELRSQDEKDELPGLATNLKAELRQKRALRNLATNPLLCAMLCALHRDRHKQLPSDRIELYEACCHMLIERRDIERGIRLKDYPALTYRQKRLLLEDLAYYLMVNGWSIISRQRAADRLESKLMNMQVKEGDHSPSRVLSFFVDRSGIIREPIPGRIDFTHRTFQEYLAAKAALDGKDIGVLREHAHDDQWRELIILAAGVATLDDREELITSLISRGDEEPSHRHQLHLLAVACLEASVELGQKVKREVEERLARLVPPKNITEAKALASAGELAVPYLSASRSANSATAAACVRTLALIGGETALDAIVQFRGDRRQKVVNELVKAWDLFDRENYAARVLDASLTHLHLDRVSSLDGLHYLKELRRLSIHRCEQITDWTPLSNLQNLMFLDLRSCNSLRSLSLLRSMYGLRTVVISGCRQLVDLTGIQGLSEVESLHVSGVQCLYDLNPLSDLRNLKTLLLGSCRGVSDLSPLTNMPNLEVLRLFGCSEITDLSPLSRLHNLSVLELTGCHQVTDLSSLGVLRSLKTLRITDSQNLRRLDFVRDMIELESLRVTGMECLNELDMLADLNNLKAIELGSCQHVNDLAPLAHLKELVWLALVGCKEIDDIAAITRLTNLEVLQLTGLDQLQDIAPLSGLHNLRVLVIGNCSRLNDLSPLESLRELWHVFLIGLPTCKIPSDLDCLVSIEDPEVVPDQLWVHLSDFPLVMSGHPNGYIGHPSGYVIEWPRRGYYYRAERVIKAK